MEENEQRATFRFFRSFLDAAKCLSKEDGYDFLIAIAEYALDGTAPNISGTPAGMFALAKPNLDASRKKAESGATGGSKTQANAKQNASKRQANAKQNASNPEAKKEEGRRKKEEGSNNPPTPQTGGEFETFWNAYPKKVGKQSAKKAFDAVKVPVEALVTAIKRQECSAQWSKDGGQYIPNPATWLNQGRWEDELEPAKAKTEYSGQFVPGEAEMEATRQLQQWREKMHREETRT